MTTHESKKKGNSTKLTVILMLLVLAIVIVPQVIKSGAEFGGSDDQAGGGFCPGDGGADGEAEAAIGEINPDYEPWFSSFYEPASGEIESLLFASQAALGAGIVGYYIGVTRTKHKMKEEK